MTSDGSQGSPQLTRHQLAYQACLAEMQRLPREHVHAVNLDVMDAVRIVMGLSERVAGIRGAVAGTLNDFDLALWDKHETYMSALVEAHNVWCVAIKSRATDSELIGQARQQFELLMAVVQALVSRGLVEPAIVKRVRKRRGPLRYAYGLLDLVEVLRERWSKIADKTGLTEAELLQAELTGERLATGVARKNAPAEHTQQLADMRDRAFTLFVYAYGQVRRAVQYLRWANNDAETFAPSLYKRRHRRVRTRRASAVQPANGPQLDLPVPSTPIEGLSEGRNEPGVTHNPAAGPRGGLSSCAAPDADGRDELPSAACRLVGCAPFGEC
jgi:hypothetical protein